MNWAPKSPRVVSQGPERCLCSSKPAGRVHLLQCCLTVKVCSALVRAQGEPLLLPSYIS